jgi:hypothetical protein
MTSNRITAITERLAAMEQERDALLSEWLELVCPFQVGDVIMNWVCNSEMVVEERSAHHSSLGPRWTIGGLSLCRHYRLYCWSDALDTDPLTYLVRRAGETTTEEQR